ncbi:MAG TPA: hypothetical protein VJB91_02305 [Patescibacteria group bacterium]|nr:hypothetical protein [Patescibacteria group bacterium]
MELSERQTKILKAIVEKYMDTAEPVGSHTLERESEFGVSPATLRNEMARLEELGFLTHPHTSAGRVPTTMGTKYYINELMKEKALSVADEVRVKEKVWDYRFEADKLLREATRSLATQTGTLAVATTNEGDLYYSGAANILDMPEFYNIDLTRTVLALLDRQDFLCEILSKAVGEGDIHILIGDDFESPYLSQCSLVFSDYSLGKKYTGQLGVIGPYRLHYPTVIPVVRYVSGLLEELTRAW